MSFKPFLRPRFSLRTLLLLVVVFALGLSMVVGPRLERERKLELLESRADVVGALWFDHDQGDQPGWIDRLLGIDSRRLSGMRFKAESEEPALVPKQLLVTAAELSPFRHFELENVEVEEVSRYPQVTSWGAIRNLGGKHAEPWLRGFLALQPPLDQGWEIRKTSTFSDQHLEMLCQTGTQSSVLLETVNITGSGFRALTQQNQGLKVFLLDCPLTDAGLQQLVAKSEVLDYLWIAYSKKSPEALDFSLLANLSPKLTVRVGIHKQFLTAERQAVLDRLKQSSAMFDYERIH